MAKLNIGIMGAGFIARVHAGVLACDERVQLTAIYDVVPEAAERLATSYNATAVATTLELLERSDAVYITTPNTQHVSLACAAIETGKQVISEKPLASNVADAERVIEESKQSGGIFQGGLNRRVPPVYARLKQIVTETPQPHSA